MWRYFWIFIATIVIVLALAFIIPIFIWRLSSDLDYISYIGTSLVLLAAFVIAQLFYIIDLIKKK